MYLLASLAAVSLVVLLILEGQSFFARKEDDQRQPKTPQPSHLRLFGGLTLLIALPIGLLQLLLLVDSTLIYSPEFGAFLVQGVWAKSLLATALAAIAIAATLLWHVARVADAPEKNRLDRGLALRMTAGAVVAASSVLEIHALQGGTDPPIYAFDLWWPPMVAWLTICLAQAAGIMIGIKGKYRRPGVTAVALLLVSALAANSPEFVDARSSSWWSVLTAAAALVFVVLAAVGIFRRGEQRWWSWMTSRVKECGSLQYKSLAQIVIAILPVLAFGRIVHLETAGPSLALSALVIVWIVLAEAFGGEPLIQASRWPIVKSLRKDGSFWTASNVAWSHLLDFMSAVWRRLRPPAATAKAGDTQQQQTAPFKASFASTALKAVVGVAIVVAVSDLPNARRTLIYPFDAGDLATDKAVAQEFPTWVLREIDVLQQELAPLMIVSNGQQREQKISAAPVVNGVDAAISKSSDLEYGSVRIPLSLLVVPIQTPVRKVIGARVITGTLHGDTESYSAVAMATSGEIWSAAAPATAFGTARKPVDALNALASHLAFEIVATSTPPAAGLTRSADAFADFRQGLVYWNEYQQDNWDSLSKAIDAFRSAVAKDPTFSLAYYRLGVALQEESRPSAASEAFTASISANPTFAPSYVAKANVLYHFNWYRNRLLVADAVAASARVAEPATDDAVDVATTARLDEARRLWRKVLTFDSDIVSASDRAASYFGLCGDAQDHPDNNRHESGYAAYYYCRRAADLYTAMNVRDSQITTTHSWVLDTLGLMFEQRLSTMSERKTNDWHCSAGTINFDSAGDDGTMTTRQIGTGPYLANAREYYQRALAIAPLDPVILCNAASVAYAMGDADPMHTLEGTSAAHAQLAGGVGYNATHPERAHRVALREYEEAIVRDPANTDARNGYAYRFWEWQYAATQTRLVPPDEETAARAEAHAREAVRIGSLTSGSPSHQAMLLSTLGEVLLAEGRWHEAIWELRKAKYIAPAHTAFDQVRWDLKLADQCALAADRKRDDPPDDIQTNLYEAEEMTTLIDTHARARETARPKGSSWLDLSQPSSACVEPFQSAAPKFELTTQAARGYAPCEWLGVTARIDDPAAPRAFLRIIGRDVHEPVAPADGASHVFLTSAPAPTHGDYFARLEDDKGNALSRTVAFDTHAECTQNLITLVFRSTPPTPSAVQTSRAVAAGGRSAPGSRTRLTR